MYNDGITRRGISNKLYSSGIGYIITPPNLDEETYIRECYAKEQVSMFTHEGGLYHNVRIDRRVLQDIEFPTAQMVKEGKTGSAVVYVTEYVKNLPIIVAVLSKGDETQTLSDKEFKLVKSLNGNLVTISGRGDTGEISISAIGNGDNGRMTINVSNSNKSAQLNLVVKGNINIDVDGDTNLQVSGDINLKSDGVVNLHDGSQPIPLGDELKTQIEKSNAVLNAILTVVNAMPPVLEPGNGAASALQAAFKLACTSLNVGVFTNINSDKSFTD